MAFLRSRVLADPPIDLECRRILFEPSKSSKRHSNGFIPLHILIENSAVEAGAMHTSALGQKQTLKLVRAMSALPSEADMVQLNRDVRFVPKADIWQRRVPARELLAHVIKA